jgi:hypothetical protein
MKNAPANELLKLLNEAFANVVYKEESPGTPSLYLKAGKFLDNLVIFMFKIEFLAYQERSFKKHLNEGGEALTPTKDASFRGRLDRTLSNISSRNLPDYSIKDGNPIKFKDNLVQDLAILLGEAVGVIEENGTSLILKSGKSSESLKNLETLINKIIELQKNVQSLGKN